MSEWLAERGVALVAMEATGVYWKSVYYALEHRFELWLCNAHQVKNVPGRKTDISDAEWLADVAAHGMVRPSFVPPPPIRELRELTRYRKTQLDARASEIARLEKLLQDAGIKLTSVASKVLTQSGRAMIEALIAGERDPQALAGLAKGKLRPKIPELTEALDGHFGAHHAIAATRILEHLDFLDATIAALSAEIAQRVAAGYQRALDLLLPVPGLDRLTIEVVIAETGADRARFPSPAQLASWAGLCPGNHESAGRRRRVATPPGNEWLRRTLIEAARGCREDEGQLLRRPVPSDRPPQRPEQSRRRGRPQPARPDLAPAQHRRAVPRPRRRLLRAPSGPQASNPSPGQPARATRIHGHPDPHRHPHRIDPRLPTPQGRGTAPTRYRVPELLQFPSHFTPDRAPPVLLHHDQLARQTAGQPPGRDRPDRLHHDQHRPEGLRPPRPQ